MRRLPLMILGLAVLPDLAAAGVPTLPVFDAARFARPVANDYFPMETGTTRRLTGTIAADDGSRLPYLRVRTITGPGPVITGVQTIAILDEEFEDGRIIERSRDYYATDDAGAVWYFGEDVTEFAYDHAGVLTDEHPGAEWKAGVNGASPGIVITAGPISAGPVFKAYAPGENEMEYNLAAGTALSLTVPAGDYTDVVRVLTLSTADPALRDYSWWARGVGLIRVEEDLSPKLDAPKVIAALTK